MSVLLTTYLQLAVWYFSPVLVTTTIDSTGAGGGGAGGGGSTAVCAAVCAAVCVAVWVAVCVVAVFSSTVDSGVVVSAFLPPHPVIDMSEMANNRITKIMSVLRNMAASQVVAVACILYSSSKGCKNLGWTIQECS